MVEVVVALFALSCLGLPIVATGWLLRRFRRWQRARADRFAETGAAYLYDLPVILSTLVFGSGAVLAGFSVIPALIWIFDGDLEGRRVFLLLLVLFAMTTAIALWCGRRAAWVWAVDERGLVEHRVRSSRRIDFESIVRLRERRHLLGGIAVEGGASSILVPGQIDAFDDLLARLRQASPAAEVVSIPTSTRRADKDPERTAGQTSWSVSRRKTRAFVAVYGIGFAVCWIGPWLVTEETHYVRDSLIFMAIGSGMWLLFIGLLSAEKFQRDQPAEIAVVDGVLQYRCFRKRPVTRPASEVVSVTLEPDIVYVKGMPGRRNPLVLTFVDGDRLRIDDFRAKDLGTRTHWLAADLRALLCMVPSVPVSGPLPSDIDRLREDIAAGRRGGGDGSLRSLGDLLRAADDRAGAVHAYRAHLDHVPDDARAWEGLVAAYRADQRDDLAAGAAEIAERIHLRP